MTKYEIYNKMFNYSLTIEDNIKRALINIDPECRIYTCEIFVGDEDTRKYEVYVEFKNKTGYQFIRGLYTLQELNKMFKMNVKDIFQKKRSKTLYNNGVYKIEVYDGFTKETETGWKNPTISCTYEYVYYSDALKRFKDERKKNNGAVIFINKDGSIRHFKTL